MKKVKGQVERETAKGKKAEKELEVYKSWLAEISGVRKVFEGCEQSLMTEIRHRLANYSKH